MFYTWDTKRERIILQYKRVIEWGIFALLVAPGIRQHQLTYFLWMPVCIKKFAECAILRNKMNCNSYLHVLYRHLFSEINIFSKVFIKIIWSNGRCFVETYDEEYAESGKCGHFCGHFSREGTQTVVVSPPHEK